MRRNYRGLIFGIILVAVLISVVVFVATHRPSTPTAIARIGYLSITASLPLYIAEEKGFFDEEGVRVESQPIATSNQLVDGIASGHLDIAVEASAVPALAVELQSPGRLKVFALSAITKDAPFDSLLVKESSAIHELRDLEGKRIGVFPGSTASRLLKRFLSDKGLNVTDVIFVPTPPQDQLTALIGGSVDAIHAYEPTTAIALNGGGVRKLYGSVYAEMLDRNPQGVAIVSTDFLRRNPEAAKAAIRALERGMVFMRQDDAEARRILAARLALNPQVADRAVFLYMQPHDVADAEVFQRYANMLTDVGELDRSVNTHDLLYSE